MRARLALGSLVVLLAAGCKHEKRAGGTPPSPSPSVSAPPEVTTPQVTATIASVTLADDCGKSAALDDVKTMRNTASQAKRAASTADSLGTSSGNIRPACLQTNLQLGLAAGPGTGDSSIEIVKVELLDEATKAGLGELVARDPSSWDGASYVTWDGKLGPAKELKTSWNLSAPDWSKLGGSREAAAGKNFLVRVTLRVNGKESTVDKVVQSPLIKVEPAMLT